MAKLKYYVVWKGARPGIYDSWDECSRQIKGYPGAMYKSFPSLEEASSAFKQPPASLKGSGTKKPLQTSLRKEFFTIIRESICVDAAWNTESKVMEYRGVYLPTGELLFHKGPFYDATNNIGEFLAIVHGLSFLKLRKSSMPVYSDSHTAITWVRSKKAKTKLERSALNTDLFDLISRAEAWLQNNPYENKVLKWDTASWGEIPADFGRK